MIEKIMRVAWRVAVLVLLALILAAMPRPRECATCGARTYDSYQILTQSGQLVDVCPTCYLEVRAQEGAFMGTEGF